MPGTDVDTAFVATGEDFPDALAGGAFAAAQYGPIVLVRRDEMPPGAVRIMADLPSLTSSFVLGGEGVVSAGVQAAFPNPARLAGADRYATAAAIGDRANSESESANNLAPSMMAVATGENFPDALSLGPAVGALGGPIVLTRTASLPPDTSEFLGRHGKDAVIVLIGGGTGAVSDEVEAQMEAAY
jgi:hypothetical protein